MTKKGAVDGLLKYGIRKTPITKANGEQRVGLYPITGEAIEAESIYDSIQKKCTLTRADIKSVVSALKDELVEQFRMGRACNLDDLGIFSPKISFEGMASSADEVVNADVYVSGVSFRPSKLFVKDLKSIKCGFSKESQVSADLSMEGLKKNLVSWFANEQFLIIDQFARFAKLSPNTARRRLKALEKSGALVDVSTFKGRIMYAREASNEYWN